jgi:hypothetical protein
LLLQQKMNLMVSKRKRVYTTLLSRRACLYQVNVRRFTYRLTWPELVRLYRLTLDAPARNLQPRYNICPTDTIDAVIESEQKRELVPMRWGPVCVVRLRAF